MSRNISIVHNGIQLQSSLDEVRSASCGAINTFVGTVRNQTKGKTVLYLDFEAYEPMALKEMHKIADQAIERWPIEHISFVHRVGKLEIGDEAVFIAVSTPHRKASFEACQFCIDTLKETVPIWKKEVFEDGEVWVAAHP